MSIGQDSFFAAMRAQGMSEKAIRRALGLPPPCEVSDEPGEARPAVRAAARAPGQSPAGEPSTPGAGMSTSGRPRPGFSVTAPAWRRIAGKHRPYFSPDDVLQEVGRATALPAEVLMGRDRSAAAVRARQLSMYLMRDLCHGMSLAEIGREIERDHSTVLHAWRRVRTRRRADAGLCTLEERVRRALVDSSRATP